MCGHTNVWAAEHRLHAGYTRTVAIDEGVGTSRGEMIDDGCVDVPAGEAGAHREVGRRVRVESEQPPSTLGHLPSADGPMPQCECVRCRERATTPVRTRLPAYEFSRRCQIPSVEYRAQTCLPGAPRRLHYTAVTRACQVSLPPRTSRVRSTCSPSSLPPVPSWYASATNL